MEGLELQMDSKHKEVALLKEELKNTCGEHKKTISKLERESWELNENMQKRDSEFLTMQEDIAELSRKFQEVDMQLLHRANPQSQSHAPSQHTDDEIVPAPAEVSI